MDIQLEKKKGIQKKHIPYIAGGAVVLFLLIWIIFGNHASSATTPQPYASKATRSTSPT